MLPVGHCWRHVLCILQEVDEYLYKEKFKGLEAGEALKVGESVLLGGEVVSVEETPAKKPMPAWMRKKMQEQTAADA